MDELVARPPSALRPPGAAPPALPRFLVAAPRCYCLLTHYPFFALHLKAGPHPTLYPGRQHARAAALPGGRAALPLPAHALPLLRAAPQGATLPYPVPWAAARPRLPAPARSGAAARAPLCALALSRLHSATAACSHTNAAPKGACCARGTHPALLLARARCAPCCGRRRGSPVCCGAPPTRRCRRGCRTFGKGLERAGGVQTPSPTLDQQPLTGRRWCRCCTW